MGEVRKNLYHSEVLVYHTPMPAKKSVSKTKCAPKIWAKFSRVEKALWKDLYALFLLPQNYHVNWQCPGLAKERHVVAHNLACETIWYMQQRADHWTRVLDAAAKILVKKSQKKKK